jgi:probable addiction module antidote protein
MKDRAHDDAMAELFAQDPDFAADYLNDLLQDGAAADLMVALRQMAQSRGGIPVLAEKAHLNPTQLYRTLSPTGNPELRSLTAILGALGLRLAVQPIATGS